MSLLREMVEGQGLEREELTYTTAINAAAAAGQVYITCTSSQQAHRQVKATLKTPRVC